MPVIDFRFRPHTREALLALSQSPIFRQGLMASGVNLEDFVNTSQSMAEIAEDLKKNGILKAVIVGRDAERTYGFLPNHDQISPFLEQYPDLFVGFAGLDPHKGMDALYQLTKLVEDKGFRGAAIDPMYAQLRANDRKYYPIYAKCCELKIPLIITTGLSPGSPRISIDSAAPVWIDSVARDFPELKIIVSHGGYPWVTEMIGVALGNPNVYLELSEYEQHPGSGAYLEAANKSLADKMLFASAHPFVAYKDAIRLYESLPFREEVREKIMWRNAYQLLEPNQ